VPKAADRSDSAEALEVCIHGSPSLPTLIYLPGTHGDCTIVTPLRNRLQPHCCFVEITYPRTTTWTLEDYARHIEAALAAHEIKQGWLLAESFGSQAGWLLASHRESGFACQGIILAGGFVRHPFPWGVRLAIKSFKWLTADNIRMHRLLNNYARFVRCFYERTSETESSIQAFIQRRNPADAAAAAHRLELIRQSDPHALAKLTRIPIHSLSGLWDALVPWYLVTPWLRRNCPGYVDSALIASADHNVLFSAPTKSARTIRKWLGRVK